ncbi:MAG: hypothetical protein ACTSWM_07280, partial [Alphaproteobacteria bacterium]
MPPVLAALGPVLTQVLISTALSVAFTLASTLLSKKPKAPQDRGIPITIRGSIEPRQITYGTDVVGGFLAFAHINGSSNQFIHLVITLGHGEIEAIDEVILEDVSITSAQIDGSGMVTSGRFANKCRIKRHLGTDDQEADTDLVSEVGIWTTNHRGRGVPYVYLRLEFDRDVYPSGLPSVRAKIRGRKVWDPRANPGNPVLAFSNNAALCQLDYARFVEGLKMTLQDIHEASWNAAANISEEQVALADGGTEARYTCDGSFHLGRKRSDYMRDLLDASLGTVVWQQGKLRGYAAAATVATDSLTVSDLRGGLNVVTRRGRESVFNAVRGTYIDETQNHIPTSFASVTNAAYQSDDKGERIWDDIALGYTKGHARAQRIAKLVLDLSRQGMSVTWPAKLTKFKIAVWDTVNVTVDKLGFAGKKFRVVDFALSPDGGIDL